MALVAALLTATEGWAMDGSDVSAARPPDATTATVRCVAAEAGPVASSARAKIPPPRKFDRRAFRPGARSRLRGPRFRRHDGSGRPPGTQTSPGSRRFSATGGPDPEWLASRSPPARGIPKAESSVDPDRVPSPVSQPADTIPVSEPPRSSAPEQPVNDPSPPIQGIPGGVSEPVAAKPPADRILTPVEELARDSKPIEMSNKTGVDADPVPVQPPTSAVRTEPAPASQATEPAAMPEAVNQALRTLSTSPAVAPDPGAISPPASTSEPQSSAKPESTRAPDNGQRKVEEPAAPTPSNDSTAKVSAKESQVRTPVTPSPT